MADRKPKRLRLLLGPAREREQQARRDFAVARQQSQAVEEVLRRCQAALGRQDAWARQAMRPGSPPGTGMESYRQCAADLVEALRRKRAELARSQEELQSRRQDMAAAMKQRKGLEEALSRQEAEAMAEADSRLVRERDQDHAARLAWQAEASRDR